MPRRFRSTAIALALLPVCALGSCGEDDLDATLRRLRSPDPAVVGQAQIALRARPDDAIPALMATLRTEDPIDRRIAALSLGVLGPKAASAVPALRTALHDENFGVRVAAIEALAAIGPAAAPAVDDLMALRNAAWWTMGNPVVDERSQRDERSALVVALAEGALGLIEGTSPRCASGDPEIEGLPISQWVRRLDGMATVGEHDEAGSRSARLVLNGAPPQAVVPSLMQRLGVRTLYIDLAYRGKVTLHDFMWNSLSRLAVEISRRDAGPLAAVLAWADQRDDAWLLYAGLAVARYADVDAGVYASHLPDLLSLHAGPEEGSLERRLQDLALDLVPEDPALRRAAVALLAWRMRTSPDARRAGWLVAISRFEEAARRYLDDIREVLRDQSPKRRLALDEELPLGPHRWSAHRDLLQMALWRIELGADAPYEALRSERAPLRRLGLEALRLRPIAEDRALDALHQGLTDEDPGVRRVAAWSLLHAGDSGLARLREAARENEIALRETMSAAARSARTFRYDGGTTEHLRFVPLDVPEGSSRLDTAALLDLAVESLDHEEGRVRADAVRALGGMGVSAARAELPLRALLAAPEWEIRANAAEALGFLGTVEEETLQAIIQLLGDADETTVRPTAAHALARLSNGRAFVLDEVLTSLGSMSVEADDWDRRHVADAAAAIVERHPDLQGVLVEALRVVSPKAQEALIEALVDSSAPSEELIRQLLTHLGSDASSGRLRATAKRTLVRFAAAGHPVVDGVARVLEEGGPKASVEAAEALGRIGYRARNEVPALEAAVAGEDEALRKTASEALRRIRMD